MTVTRSRCGVLACVLVLAMGAAPPAQPEQAAATASAELVKTPSVFQRAEPHLAAGARALEKGDVDGALEHYHRAQPESDDERAIVEYDVGAALLARAQLALKAAQAQAQAQNGGQAPDPQAPDAPDAQAAQPDQGALDDAKAAFDRAFGIAKDRRLKSEAALAAGNANVVGGKLDDAIADYRKAVVADPTNARAKLNLKRALDAKRAQPPPPPQEGGGDDDKKDDKKDGDKNEDDKKKNEDDKKKNEDDKKKNEDDKKSDEQKQNEDDKKKNEDDGQGDGEQNKDEQNKKPEEQPQPGDAAAQKKKMKKEEARRMLEMMRSRERPLTPMEMRGQQKVQKPKNGKDW